MVSEKVKLLLEKITGKIILITYCFDSLFFIELENELKEKTKDLTITNETLQITAGKSVA